MSINDEVDEYERSKEFSFGKIFQILTATLALGLAIFLVTAILEYFAPTLQIPALVNVKDFLSAYWFIIIGYVLLISFWDYLHGLYKKQLIYVKPIVDGTSLMFGLWLIVMFLKGLIVFLDPTSQTAIFLNFPHDFYLQQFVILYLLFIFVGYSKLFLKK